LGFDNNNWHFTPQKNQGCFKPLMIATEHPDLSFLSEKKTRGFAHCCDKSLAATWGVDFSPFMAQRRRCTKIERKLSELSEV
jgi:hypothetical protein